MRDLCFLDTETLGLDPMRHEVVDIYAIRLAADTLEVVGEAGGLVLPVHPETASPKALEVNGFNLDEWRRRGARRWPLVWRAVEQVAAGATLVGSNPAFDVRFIQAMCRRHGQECWLMTRWTVDTASLAHPLQRAGRVRSVSLGALVDYFGVEVDGEEHTARGDVLRSIEVYKRLVGFEEAA